MADIEADTLALTLERAAMDYFTANAKKLDQNQRVAVTRFVSWCGPTRQIAQISAHEMSLFQEAQGENVADLSQRLLPIKAFFAHAKKRKWTETNLGVHLRVKKQKNKGADLLVGKSVSDPDAIEMTAAGLDATKAELERLRAERPEISKQIGLAMEDKDFRENAPLDAARDVQAHAEARIRELEHQVAAAVVIDPSMRAQTGVAHLGSMVTVTNLVSDQVVSYTLVGQNEVDAASGHISIASPVGQALVGQRPGDMVDVTAPSGTIRFRIESIEG